MRRTPSPSCRPARIAVGLLTATSGLVVGGWTLGAPAHAAPEPQTFGATGAEQTYVVPAGVTSIRVTVTGAPGADKPGSSVGGPGRVVSADLPVTPGQTLYVEVGGPGSGTTGGFNGGGAGGTGGWAAPDNIGYGGGGASDIRTCPAAGPCASGTSLDSRLVVAGGGGGGGVNSAGGGDQPGSGSSFFPDSGGKAGTLVAGGAGGGPGNDGAAGAPGTFGAGGAGANGVGGGTPGGGGGGGGYYGGGGSGSGGASGGGGGGSSYVDETATNVTYAWDATRTPAVVIAPNAPPIVDPNPVDVTVTAGESATFTSSATGSPAVTVQWQRWAGDGPWADVPGGTEESLTVANTTVEMSGDRYRAVFTNHFGGTEHATASAAATLTVNPVPVVDPFAVDSDGDGLSDGAESTGTATCPGGSDPRRADTDGDGLADGAEVAGRNVEQRVRTRQGGVVIGRVVTSPCATDTDGDGLSDARELQGFRIKQKVHRMDGKVVRIGTFVTDPARADTDGDGLSDRSEMKGNKTVRFGKRKSSPVDYDTDRGGATDGREVARGGDPTRYWSGPHKPRPTAG
jgi:hypothetical protein